MLQEMRAEDLDNFRRLYQDQPWGPAAEDLRFAYLGPLVRFVGGPEPHKVFRSLRQKEKPQRPPTPAEAAERMKQVLLGCGARIVKE